MTLQQQLLTGRWADIPAEEEGEYLDAILARESWYAERVGRQPATSHEEIRALLASPKHAVYGMQWGDDWYACVRDREAYERVLAERASRRQPTRMVTCDCGHTVPAIQAMWANMGSSCPDCYDRMSN